MKEPTIIEIIKQENIRPKIYKSEKHKKGAKNRTYIWIQKKR